MAVQNQQKGVIIRISRRKCGALHHKMIPRASRVSQAPTLQNGKACNNGIKLRRLHPSRVILKQEHRTTANKTLLHPLEKPNQAVSLKRHRIDMARRHTQTLCSRMKELRLRLKPLKAPCHDLKQTKHAIQTSLSKTEPQIVSEANSRAVNICLNQASTKLSNNSDPIQKKKPKSDKTTKVFDAQKSETSLLPTQCPTKQSSNDNDDQLNAAAPQEHECNVSLETACGTSDSRKETLNRPQQSAMPDLVRKPPTSEPSPPKQRHTSAIQKESLVPHFFWMLGKNADKRRQLFHNMDHEAREQLLSLMRDFVFKLEKGQPEFH